MSSAALTLATRALSVAMRARTGFLMRGGLVALMIVTLLASLSTASDFGAPGLSFFSWLAYANFYVLTLIGISVFSGVITEEKESMTLGLLRLAGFTPVSIILGKSIALLCSTFLLLALELPFAVLAITMGGVSRHQILAAFCILAAHLLAVFGISLVCSVVFRSTTSAARTAAVLVFGWLFGPYLMAEVMKSFGGFGSPLRGWLFFLNDLNAANGIGQTMVRGYDVPLWNPVVTANLAIGLAGFALAWLLFSASNRDERPAGPARPKLLPRRSLGIRPSERSACLWKDFRFVSGGLRAFVVRCSAYLGLYVLLGSLNMRDEWRKLYAVNVSCACFGLEFLYLAARCFQQEIKWRTLSSLVALPYTTRTWAYSKMTGCAIQMVPVTSAVVIGVLLFTGVSGTMSTQILAVAIFYFSNVFIAGHVAAWLSLRLKRGAFALSVLTLVFLHMFFFMTCMGAGGGEIEPLLLLWSSLAVCLAFGMQFAIASEIERVAAES